MTSYFCTIKKKNWEKIRTLNIYFLNLHWENKMNKLNEGDELILYLMEEHKLIGIYQVISRAKNIENEMKIEVKPINILKKPVDFRQFINNLDLIKNPKSWGTYIQVPLRKLSEKDEILLKKSMN